MPTGWSGTSGKRRSRRLLISEELSELGRRLFAQHGILRRAFLRQGPAALGGDGLPSSVPLWAPVDQAAPGADVHGSAAPSAQVLEVTPAGALATTAQPPGRNRRETLELAGSHAQPPERRRSSTSRA